MSLAFRGFMFDSARTHDRLGYYRRLIDFAGERGLNTLLWHFTDDQGCSLRFDCVPDVASPHAFTKSQLRGLIDYAGSKGVDVIPELASFGHCVYLTRLARYAHLNESPTDVFSSLCPVHPDTRPLLTALITEAAGVFPSEHFHVGLDEVNIGHNPLTARALLSRPRARILADHVGFLHGLLKGLGRRTWMWADSLLHDPALPPLLPRDVVMCNWHYTPEVPAASTQLLLDHGFDVVLCSALISHDQPLFPGDQFALPNLRSLRRHESLAGRGKVLGSLTTVWTPVRFPSDSLWLPLHLAAGVLTDGPDVDFSARILAFAGDFYGLTSPAGRERFLRATLALFRHAPKRGEWLAAAKLDDTDTGLLDRIRGAAPVFREIRLDLRDVAPRVTRHRRAFGTFRLVPRLLAHLYATTAGLDRLRRSARARDRAIARTRSLLRRLDAAWDRERFADDPRKYAAPIAHFRDDHLIPLVGATLDRLQSLHPAAAPPPLPTR